MQNTQITKGRLNQDSNLTVILIIFILIDISRFSDKSLHGVLWSCGRASGFWSRGQMFEIRCCHFETWEIFFISRCPCLSKDTLKAAGPFHLVSMPGEV